MNRPITHPAFMAYVEDDASHAAVSAFAQANGLPESVVQPGGIEVLTKIVGEAKKLPRIILVDIDGTTDPAPALTRLIEALEGVARIIAVGTPNDVRLYRDLVTAGAVDYVVKPLTPGLLQTAYSAAQKLAKESEAEAGPAKLVTIVGARGGVGATTIAVNLGWLLAHKHEQPAVLFDLDLQFGTSTLALDLMPGSGLRQALETPGRLDSLLIASSMVSESDRFSILGAEEAIEDSLVFDGNAAMAVAAELKSSFRYVIVDMPRHLIALQRRLLSESSTIVIVAEQTLAAIRDVVRLRAAIKQIAPEAEVLTVVSRVSPGRGGERSAQVDQGTFEKGVQDKVTVLVPEDAAPVANAANRGQALGKAAPQAGVTLAIARLAAMIAGQQPTESKEALWGKVASRFRKPKAS